MNLPLILYEMSSSEVKLNNCFLLRDICMNYSPSSGDYFLLKNLSTRSGDNICQSEATVHPGAKISL